MASAHGNLNMQLRHGDWILVGDGEKVLVFVNHGDETQPDFKTLRVLEHPLPSSNTPTAAHPDEAGGETGELLDHEALRQEGGWQRIEKQKFAKEIAGALYKAAHAGRFSRLVVVAPPRTIGDLRGELHKEVADRVVAEVPKDLTNVPPYQIEQLLVTKH
jgi:protein required for attachment to host cells